MPHGLVQPAPGGGQGAQAVAHGSARRKLDEGHDGELLLEPELAGGTASLVPAFKLLENMSGDQG